MSTFDSKKNSTGSRLNGAVTLAGGPIKLNRTRQMGPILQTRAIPLTGSRTDSPTETRICKDLQIAALFRSKSNHGIDASGTPGWKPDTD